MAPYEETLFILAVLCFGAFIAWLVIRFAGERARERERRGRFVEATIEKFAESRDFIEFARSEFGQAWLRADAGETRVRGGVIVLLLVGVLSLAVGMALLVNAARLAGVGGVDQAAARADASWWGTVLTAIGAGSIVASALIARIARAWGLLSTARSDGHERGK